jgi:hypothetical protein
MKKCEICGHETTNSICNICAVVEAQSAPCPLCGVTITIFGDLCRDCHKEMARVKIPWFPREKPLESGWKDWHLAT